MLCTKHVYVEIQSYELAEEWQRYLLAGRMSAIYGPSMVESFEWTIPHCPEEGEDEPLEVSGSAEGEDALADGWGDMVAHLVNLPSRSQ